MVVVVVVVVAVVVLVDSGADGVVAWTELEYAEPLRRRPNA